MTPAAGPNFEHGRLYRRVLITGKEGHEFGYTDWEDPRGVWHYYGAGQEGPMEWVRGNRALRDHVADGKELHLFKNQREGLRYEGQYVLADVEERQDVPDKYGDPRRAFIFALVPFDDTATRVVEEPPAPGPAGSLWELPLDDLRARAAAAPDGHTTSEGARRKVYARSAALRVYVLRRADGDCEGCGAPAPFRTAKLQPYLEPHHTTRLSDGGPDHPEHVIALCPTCHRRVHYGEDGDAYNATLKNKLKLMM